MINQPIPKYISDGFPAELPFAAVFKDSFWYPINTHGPGSEQVLILSVLPQLRNCLLHLKFYLTPKVEILLQNFSLGLHFFPFLCHLSSPAAFSLLPNWILTRCCSSISPENYIGLGWAPASIGDSWVSPKQSIAICILMKVGHCLSFNVVK